MNKLTKTVAALAFGLITTTAIAAPKQLITHNRTNVESNAFVAGAIPSQHPTKANSDNKVMWAAVKMACFGYTTNGKCWALIKMATNTPNPVDLGVVTIDLETGEITPTQITASGYTMTVTGPGETMLTNAN